MDGALAERLLIVGTNHRTSGLGLRDALFIEDHALPAALASLRAAGFTQALLLSTCDRVEVVALAESPDQGAGAMVQAMGWLAARAEEPTETLARQVYSLTGADAVRHLFAVASALDSQVIGEPHVLGQVKAAHRLARDAALLGPGLETVLQAAYAAAKRVRTETAIAEGPVSVAASATQAARDLFGDLARCRLLLVGGADMGDLVTESLMAAGLADVQVSARRPSRAESLATLHGGHVVPFETLATALVDTDIVVTAIGGRTYALSEETVKAALKKRRQKPILLVDVGVPGDIDPVINRVDNAFLYDLNDLETLAEKGRTARESVARAAWAIIAEEVAGFLRARAERAAVPGIAALRRRFEAERTRALAEAGADAEKATRLLVGRLLHDPSEVLRQAAADGKALEGDAQTLLRLLFRLDGDPDPDTLHNEDTPRES